MEQATTINDLLFELNMVKLRRKYQFWLLAGLILFILSLITFLITLVESSGFYYGIVFLIYSVPYFVASLLLLIGAYLMREDYHRLKRMRGMLYPNQDGYGSERLDVYSGSSYPPSGPPPPPPQ